MPPSNSEPPHSSQPSDSGSEPPRSSQPNGGPATLSNERYKPEANFSSSSSSSSSPDIAMSSLLTSQPFKCFYLAYEGLTMVFLRLPFWTLLALPAANRPRPSWPIKRVLILWWLKHRTTIFAKAGRWWHEPDYRAIEPKVKAVWIPAVPHLIVGEVKQWAASNNVDAVDIPGYWIEKKGVDLPINARPQAGEKVLYALHGGGYAAMSAHPDDLTSNISRGILKHVGPFLVRAFQVEYRNSKPANQTPSNPFPAALLDAIAGYNYLIQEVGFAPEDIIVEGDSAGGNLALALARYLLDNQGRTDITIPRAPAALILNSPWVDLGPEPSDSSSSIYTNKDTDYLYLAGPGYTFLTGNFFGNLGYSAGYTNRYISPASQSPCMGPISFKGFPRTFISSGGAEVLRDQIRVLRDRMEDDLGSNLKYTEASDAWHDFLAFPEVEPERSEVLHLIADWLQSGL